MLGGVQQVDDFAFAGAVAEALLTQTQGRLISKEKERTLVSQHWRRA